MKWIAKRIIIMLVVVVTQACALSAHIGGLHTQAKDRQVMLDDCRGDSYVYSAGKMRKGWLTYKGKRYYAHHTGSESYPEGSVTKNAFRVKNGKLYFFDASGAKITHSTKYIILNRKGTSVHYILTPGDPDYRYNANRHIYQIRKNGHWERTGGRCYPVGLIDWQR